VASDQVGRHCHQAADDAGDDPELKVARPGTAVDGSQRADGCSEAGEQRREDQERKGGGGRCHAKRLTDGSPRACVLLARRLDFR